MLLLRAYYCAGYHNIAVNIKNFPIISQFIYKAAADLRKTWSCVHLRQSRLLFVPANRKQERFNFYQKCVAYCLLLPDRHAWAIISVLNAARFWSNRFYMLKYLFETCFILCRLLVTTDLDLTIYRRACIAQLYPAVDRMLEPYRLNEWK